MVRGADRLALETRIFSSYRNLGRALAVGSWAASALVVPQSMSQCQRNQSMAMAAPIAQPINFSFRLRACSGLLIDRPLAWNV
jgi:hypothetical protein